MKSTCLLPVLITLTTHHTLFASSQILTSNLSLVPPNTSPRHLPLPLQHYAALFNPLQHYAFQHPDSNSMLLSEAPRLHRGEREMRDRMRVPFEGDTSPSSPFLTPQAMFMLQKAPLLALGALDDQGRPWTTLWGSESPFAQVLAENVVGVRARVDAEHDPVVEALMRGAAGGKGTVRLVDADGSAAGAPGGDNGALNEVRRVGGLTLDLETRKRVKLAGRMMVADLSAREGEDGGGGGGMDMTLVARIEESLGNCPKYINKKHIVSAPATSKPTLLSTSPQLCPEAITLLSKADLFFVSSLHEQQTMDTNHRGGPAGFVRITSNPTDGAELIWPEYSGNRLYQTLGNFVTTPLAGLIFPDFDNGDALYVTGVPRILVGPDAAALLPRSSLAVSLKVTAARFVQASLPFRGQSGDPSPYNPSLRFASSEKVTPGAELGRATGAGAGAGADRSKGAVARLVARDDLTPTISRFRFAIEGGGGGGGGGGSSIGSGPTSWQPGQYATLSFADELDVGYSHMRDDDPRSLNDDWVRTFTVSRAPSSSLSSSGATQPQDSEFELTIRRVGNATTHLFRQNVRAGFELPLLGFEGDFQFPGVRGGGGGNGSSSDGGGSGGGAAIPVIAAGIGITPLLGQLGAVNASRLRLLWTVNVVDLGLVADAFERFPDEMGRATVALFVTGGDKEDGDDEETEAVNEALAGVKKAGVRVERRRMEREDVLGLDGAHGGMEWFICVGTRLRRELLGWLEGKRGVYEDFGY